MEYWQLVVLFSCSLICYVHVQFAGLEIQNKTSSSRLVYSEANN